MNTPFWAARSQSLETPCVLVDVQRLDANIARMQAKADALGLRLRPHVKTHKSPDIAFRQLAAGAAGVTVATCEEARAFLEAGVPSLTMAYPQVQPGKLAKVMALAMARGAEMQFTADSLPVLQALGDAASRQAAPDGGWGVFIEVDVGLGRCGVTPESGVLLELAQAMGRFPGLRWAGLLSHAGHAYAAPDPEAVRAIAGEEILKMALARLRVQEAGHAPGLISVGATPTCLAAAEFPGVGELRPGNYVFLDHQAVRQGLATVDEPALWVLATCVSRTWKHCILDVGSKTLSSDLGAHGLGGAASQDDAEPCFGWAYPMDGSDDDGYPIVRLSEEHGFLLHGGVGPRVGERVRILPRHACAVANLASHLVAAQPDAGADAEAWTVWPVAARPGRDLPVPA